MRFGALTLVLACAPTQAQELLAYMEPRFHAFEPYRTVVSWPVVEADSAEAWSGSEYVVPTDGIYSLTLQVWVENVAETPMLVGTQVWDQDGVIAWDSAHVTAPYGDSLAATLHIHRYTVLRAGERLHVQFFTQGDATVSGYPHESWLSIVRIR